jgi:thiosulfate dehydrogenase
MSGNDNPFAQTIAFTIACCSGIVAVIAICLILVNTSSTLHDTPQPTQSMVRLKTQAKGPEMWNAPSESTISEFPESELIRYGRELIVHTSIYLGPKGIVGAKTNGMNCQNCHLQAGTKPFGNNYAKVYSTYPKFRARSGTIETVEKRINDCIERSLNGVALADTSREIRAIKAYILWVGHQLSKEKQEPVGAGLGDLPLLGRAADPGKGKEVFLRDCSRCHGEAARGRRRARDSEWLYPPLAGDSSYNTGAGLFRLSRFAAYVKFNMPDGTSYTKPHLTDEEAWDVAAYINSLPRPGWDLSHDWPDISKKPFDHPFGPYADSFSVAQHKYGPFQPIKDFQAYP